MAPRAADLKFLHRLPQTRTGTSNRKAALSVPIPKFAIPCRTLSCELRNQRETSKFMILVPLLNPKFAIGLAANACELRVRGTGNHRFASAPLLPKFVSEGDAIYHELRKRGTGAMAWQAAPGGSIRAC